MAVFINLFEPSVFQNCWQGPPVGVRDQQDEDSAAARRP